MRRYSFAAVLVLAMATPWLPSSSSPRSLAMAVVTGAISVVTQHDDNNRSGAKLDETILTTSTVNVNHFGLLFRRTVDGQIYAQPLYVSGVPVAGQGTHNVVYVATMHNTVYAFDADNAAQSKALWSINLGPSVPTIDFGSGYLAIQKEVGILSTPVIDLNSKTLYAVAFTKESGSYIYRLHALDITSGTEKFGGPVVITATVPGTGAGSSGGVLPFNDFQHLQRPGLLLSNGVVYVSFASHEDLNPYHGWLLGYAAGTLKQVFVYNSTPNGNPGQGGFWASGQGPAADAAGNIYVITGNGDFDANNPGGTEYGDSFIKLNPSAASPVVDWFTPYNEAILQSQDLDLGNGGPLLLPGTSLIVGGGKQGKLYVVDSNNMGHFNAGGDTQIVQSFQATPGQIHGSPVYWNGPSGQLIYLWGDNDYLKAYRFTNGLFQTTPAYTSTMTAPNTCGGDCSPGGILAVSAHGSAAGSGILWASLPLHGNAHLQTQPGILRAFDASNVSHELWDSAMNSKRDAVGNFAKFCPPTIANGKVYLATFSGYLDVYGRR